MLLSVLAERRLLAGQTADLAALLDDLAQPPIGEIGALEINDFLPKNERKALSAALNTLLASPTFASWRQALPRMWATGSNPNGGAPRP